MMDGPSTVCLPPTGETWFEFSALGAWLAEPWLSQGSKSVDAIFLFLFLSLCVSY